MHRMVEQTPMNGEQGPIQKSFGSLGVSDEAAWPADRGVAKKHERKKAWVPVELAEFERRMVQRGHTRTTAATQMRSVRSVVKVASRGRVMSAGVLELFADVVLGNWGFVAHSIVLVM